MFTWLRREGTINKALIAQANIGQGQRVLELGSEATYPLPYPTNSFDRVLSSHMFHRLTTPNKHRALAEMFRVLKPGGELHIAEFGKPHRFSTRLISNVVWQFDQAADLMDGLLPEMIRRAGFIEDEEPGCFTTLLGTLRLYKAQKPGE